jgi:dienelactone hydrolase
LEIAMTPRRTLLRVLYLGAISSFVVPSSSHGSQEKAEEVAQTEREVTFEGANGVKLAATLLIPARRPNSKVPGIVIVAGSGSTDRNGNAAGVTTNLYKQVAELLLQDGIASLRYDKRSIGASDKPKNAQSLPEFTRWENFVADAAAALAFLQDQPEIDANRTAMMGHSEGGMLALQAAVEVKGLDKPPVALVLAATPGRRGDIVLRQQIARNAFLFSKKNDEIMSAIKETGQVPDDVPALLAPVYPPHCGKFLQSVLNFEGAAWASRFPGPVLVLYGEKDANHEVAKETAALADGLKKRQPDDHEMFVVPGASHCLKPVKNMLDLGYEGEIAPEAGGKLREWLRKSMKSTREK